MEVERRGQGRSVARGRRMDVEVRARVFGTRADGVAPIRAPLVLLEKTQVGKDGPRESHFIETIRVRNLRLERSKCPWAQAVAND